jgi:hypothetical protein
MSQPIHSAGLKLLRGDGASPPAFHHITKVDAIDPVGSTKPQLDVTTFDSTQREYVPGLRDGSELSIKAKWQPDDADGQVAFKDDYDTNAANRIYRIDFPKGVNANGDRAEFEASITEMTLGAELDNVIMLNAKLKISGTITCSKWT